MENDETSLMNRGWSVARRKKKRDPIEVLDSDVVLNRVGAHGP